MLDISADDSFANSLIQNTSRFCMLHGLNVCDKGRINFLIFIVQLAKQSLCTARQSHVCVYYSYEIQTSLSTIIEQCFSKLLLSFGNNKIVALSIHGTRDLVEVRRSPQTGVCTPTTAVWSKRRCAKNRRTLALSFTSRSSLHC